MILIGGLFAVVAAGLAAFAVLVHGRPEVPDGVPPGWPDRIGLRQRDGWLILGVLGVLLMYPVHEMSQFAGFVLRPDKFVGDYWRYEVGWRIAALVAKEIGALMVVGCGVLGARGGRTGVGRLLAGGAVVAAGVVFAAVEALFEGQAIADTASRIGQHLI